MITYIALGTLFVIGVAMLVASAVLRRRAARSGPPPVADPATLAADVAAHLTAGARAGAVRLHRRRTGSSQAEALGYVDQGGRRRS